VASEPDEVEHSWTEMTTRRGMHTVDDDAHRRGAGRMAAQWCAMMRKMRAPLDACAMPNEEDKTS